MYGNDKSLSAQMKEKRCRLLTRKVLLHMTYTLEHHQHTDGDAFAIPRGGLLRCYHK